MKATITYWSECNGKLITKYSDRKTAVKIWKSLVSDKSFEAELFDSQFRFVSVKNRNYTDIKRFLPKISTARKKENRDEKQ